MAGLTSTGFVIRTLPEIRADINDRLRPVLGPQIDLSDATAIGSTVGIFSERISEVWQLAEAVNAASDPDAAEGAQLEALSALTGTVRAPATPSAVTLALTGAAATVVPIGSRAQVVLTEESFVTLANATLVLATAWAASTTLALGVRRSNASRVYEVVGAGTTAASGGPTTTAASILDGSVLWRYLGEGLSVVNVAAEAALTGPISAPSGSITVIETPVSGWSSVINTLDAVPGTVIEVDENLRIRREIELAAPGTAPVDAIRAELLVIEDVTAVTVFHNPTDTTDAAGVPPHSVEALVQGGVDQAIRDTLLDSVAAGVATHGTVTGTATDDAGNVHTVKFSRPTLVLVYVTVTVTKNAEEYPIDGDAQIEDAILAWGLTQKAGYDVRASALVAQAFKVPGVLDVVALIGIAPSPATSSTIVVAGRELATYDTSRTTVTSVAGTP